MALDLSTMNADYKICTYDDSVHREETISLWERVNGYEAAHNKPSLVLDIKLAVRDGLVFLALRDNKIVGTVMGGYDGRRGWLYSVVVHPDYRKLGIGSMLVRHVEQALESLGCLKVNLQIMDGNEAVSAFYESLGYGVEKRVSMGKRIGNIHQ